VAKPPQKPLKKKEVAPVEIVEVKVELEIGRAHV
jgi:hypothetical protein